MFQAVHLENYFVPVAAGLLAPTPPVSFPYQAPESGYTQNYRGPMRTTSVCTDS